MIKTLTIYPAKILAGILAGFLSLFVQNLLPKFLDGKNLSVVEKTDDTELLTDGIEDNVFYVRFNSSTPNYIVVETD